MDHLVELRLKSLKEENDMLRERVSFLERAMAGGEPALPIEWRLTRQEAKVFGALLAREFAGKEFVYMALYGARPYADVAIPKICNVFICKIRRKLSPFGVNILTDHGQGWRLDPKFRERFLAERCDLSDARRHH